MRTKWPENYKATEDETIKVIIESVIFYTNKINNVYSNLPNVYFRMLPLSIPKVKFNLRGKVAGRGGIGGLRFNLELAKRNLNDYVNDTVPHELCHYFCMMLFNSRYTKPHGHEWKTMMKRIGINPTRCHNMDISFMRDKLWKCCGCGREYLVSNRKHNAMMKNPGCYFCRGCKSGVVFVEIRKSA